MVNSSSPSAGQNTKVMMGSGRGVLLKNVQNKSSLWPVKQSVGAILRKKGGYWVRSHNQHVSCQCPKNTENIINHYNYYRLLMFWSLYEITRYSQIAKQAFAKTPNSMIIPIDATRKKVRWVAWRGREASETQLKHRRVQAKCFVHNASGQQQQDCDYDY